MIKIKKYLTVLILTTLSFSQVKVACIGNSITYGSFLANPVTESYPAQLQQKLGKDHYVVYNYGAPGRTLLNGFSVSYINSAQYLLSISQHHDIIIILLGTNDTNPQFYYAIDNFISDYKSLISAYNNFPTQDTPLCIVGIPPPIYNINVNDYLVGEIIPRINTVANQTNNSIANFYNALQNKAYLFIDGIHPTVQGAEVMANIAKQAIEKALNPAPATPINFTASASDGLVTLSWDANTEPDLAKYNIYRGTVDGGWKDLLINLDKNITSYLDTELDNYTTYYYQMNAQNTYNNLSARTKQISATPGGLPDTTPPATPTNLTASTSEGLVTLSWDANTESDLSIYNIYRGTVDGGWKDYLASVDKITTTYIDVNIDGNTSYFYSIDATDDSGNRSDRCAQISTTTLYILNNIQTIGHSLKQNTPNPFNPITEIEFSIPIDTKINIVIYDLMGYEIKTLINEYKQRGQYTVNWDGNDNCGQSVSGGIYFYKLQAGDFIKTRKMVLLK